MYSIFGDDMKTLIALTSRDVVNKEGFYASQKSYMMALESVNANYITITPNSSHDYEDIASICDGLLICGGRDIDSKFFHESLHKKSEIVKEEIDIMDFKLIEAFCHQNKPILGICRGIQVLNVYFGGSLYQDIPSQYKTKIIHSQNKERHIATHHVSLTKDSFLGNEGQVIAVNSFHHQAIKQLAKGFEVVALSEDGLIEAIQYQNIMGVQWHPECMINQPFHQRIFQTFIHRCQK